MSGLFGTGQGQPIATQDNRANGMQLQSSDYGKALPVVYGRSRIAGELIWYGDFQALEHQQQVGKGGGGNVSTSYTYSSSFAVALCEGPIQKLGTIWNGSGTVALGDINGTLMLGAAGQAPWSHWTGADALNYPYVAYVGCLNLLLGSSPNTPNLNFEIYGLLPFNAAGGIYDAEPSAIVSDLLTSATHGADFAQLGDLTQYRDYCTAMGIFISPVLDTETSLSDLLDGLLQITNSTVLWFEGTLTFVPYGDQPVTGNGVTYTPATTVQAELGPDDFIKAVQIERKPLTDLNNVVRLEFLDSTQNYVTSVCQVQDQADADLRGVRSEQDIQAHGITNSALAMLAAQQILQRNLYIRNTYTFSLGLSHIALAPGDIVGLTDPLLGLNQEPVRITAVKEGDDLTLDITAEEFPAGVAAGAQYPTQVSAGYVPNVHGSPDATQTPVFFRAPQFLADKPEVWVGVAGAGPNWGGAYVWMSYDNAHYTRVGVVYPGCRYGELSGALATGADPDTTNNFGVDLYGPGQLNGGTQQDADELVTLLLVDQELVSYETTVLNGDGTYTLGNGYLRRGAYLTAIAAHAVGAPWLRIDGHIFRWQFDPGDVGKTVYIKFQAFNLYGGGAQDLSTLTAYSYVLGAAEEVPDVPPVPTNFAVATIADGVKVSWSSPNPAAVAMTSVERSTDNATWGVIAQVKGDFYPDHFSTGATFYYRARAHGAAFLWSAYTPSLSAAGKTVYSQADIDAQLAAYVQSTVYNDGVAGLQSQIDGQVDSWFYLYDPTTTNEPASEWTTTTLQNQHLNDTFTNVWDGVAGGGTGTAGASWRWVVNAGVYSWQLIGDTATQQALLLAGQAQDTADNKRRVFVAQPTTPYDIGDLWVNGNSIYNATVARASGAFVSGDWTLRADLTSQNTALDTTNVLGVSAPSVVSRVNGFQCIQNPDFALGLSPYNVYDNNSTGNVAISLVADNAAPNSTGTALQIVTSAGSAPSPGLGGFYYPLAKSLAGVLPGKFHPGDRNLVTVVADVPVGYTLNFAFNSLGTGGSATWKTPQAGTGTYQPYTLLVLAGTDASMLQNVFPYFYLTGGAAPVTWKVAQLTCTDIDQTPRFGVIAIDDGQRALVDATQAGHVGAWNLDTRVVEAGSPTYSRSRAAAMVGGYIKKVSQDGSNLYNAKGTGDSQQLNLDSEIIEAATPVYRRVGSGYSDPSGRIVTVWDSVTGVPRDGGYVGEGARRAQGALDGTFTFTPGLDKVPETGGGQYLRLKQSQQTAFFNKPSQGHVVDPTFTSVADFWSNVGTASAGVFTLPALTANQGFSPSAYNTDGRGNPRQIAVKPGDIVVMQITTNVAATGTVSSYFVALFVNAAGADLGVYPAAKTGAAGTTTVSPATAVPANAVGMRMYFQGQSGVSGGNNASVSNPVVRINHETVIDANAQKAYSNLNDQTANGNLGFTNYTAGINIGAALQAGTGLMDGGSVTFGTALAADPFIKPDYGALSYDSTITGSQCISFIPTFTHSGGQTVGFTASIKINGLMGAPTGQSVNFSSNLATLTVPAGSTIVNSALTVSGSVHNSGQEINIFTVVIKDNSTGTTLLSKNITVSAGATKPFSYQANDAAAVNGTVINVSDSTGSTSGTTVTYQTATAPTPHTATPAGSPGINWTAYATN